MKGNEILAAGKPAGQNPIYRILVVDDDVAICKLSADTLSQAGFSVDTAENGSLAWETLQASSYDLLITDHHMPKLSGIDLLKKLPAARMALPVIMATGTLPTEEFKRSPWLKPAAVLIKPFTVTEMVITVQSILGAPARAFPLIAPSAKAQNPSTPHRGLF